MREAREVAGPVLSPKSVAVWQNLSTEKDLNSFGEIPLRNLITHNEETFPLKKLVWGNPSTEKHLDRSDCSQRGNPSHRKISTEQKLWKTVPLNNLQDQKKKAMSTCRRAAHAMTSDPSN